MNRSQGFTLIELVIVILVIGILAAIAIPSYQGYVLRSNRTEGLALLNEAAARQEKFFTQNSRYATTFAELGFTSANSKNNLYSLVIPANAATTEFDLQATPINSQTRDIECLNLTLNHEGIRGATGPKGVEGCWR